MSAAQAWAVQGGILSAACVLFCITVVGFQVVCMDEVRPWASATAAVLGITGVSSLVIAAWVQVLS